MTFSAGYLNPAPRGQLPESLLVRYAGVRSSELGAPSARPAAVAEGHSTRRRRSRDSEAVEVATVRKYCTYVRSFVVVGRRPIDPPLMINYCICEIAQDNPAKLTLNPSLL